MGLRITVDVDTTLGSSDRIYLRIDNIRVDRFYNYVEIGVTLWLDKQYSDKSKRGSISFLPFGQIEHKVVCYSNVEDLLGEELEIPSHFTYEYNPPKDSVDVFDFCYKKIREDLLQIFPNSKIENI